MAIPLSFVISYYYMNKIHYGSKHNQLFTENSKQKSGTEQCLFRTALRKI
jgi:hypothetical protein